MARIKLTKNELKKQKDSLARFRRYLPTLILKKQQLQMEIRKIDTDLEQLAKELAAIEARLLSWAALFCESVDFSRMLEVAAVELEEGNVAGIDIPLFKSIRISEKEYDLFAVPLWVDKVLTVFKQQLSLHTRVELLKAARQLLGDELRITSQRVNLFEKVKIVEASDNIRMIKIYLGDQQTAAVVRGKISKHKIEKAAEL